MKTTQKVFVRTVSLCFGLLLLTNCGLFDQKDPKPEDPEEETPIIDEPENIISLEEADVIYQNYSRHRIDIIERYEKEKRAPEEEFQASRFVDFDYDTIKQYIAYVDQEAAKAGVKKVTKLRLYFANYPKDKTFPNKKEVVHPRQNSIFMVPTLDRDGVNYGFYIGQDGKPSLITDWKSSMEKGMGLLNKKPQKAFAGFSLNSSLYAGSSLTLNFGHGGPPPKTDFE